MVNYRSAATTVTTLKIAVDPAPHGIDKEET